MRGRPMRRHEVLLVGVSGSVVRGAEDTPNGRLAADADPTGAGFNLSSLEN